MAIHFKLIKSPSGIKPAELRKRFGENGGYVGRATNNDWILKDPNRFLSARHCQVSFRGDRFYLTDLSTNGTFINGKPEPVGRGVEVPLADGDTVDLGEYRFKVTIDGAKTKQAPSVQQFPRLDLIEVEEQPLPGKTPMPDGAGFIDLIGMPSDLAKENAPVNRLSGSSISHRDLVSRTSMNHSEPGEAVYGADSVKSSIDLPASTPSRAGPARDDCADSAKAPSGQKRSEPDNGGVADAKSAVVSEPRTNGEDGSRSVPPLRSVNKSGESGDPERALLNALGFKNTLLTESQSYTVHQTVGILLRECVGGLLQVLRSRASIKNEFRMNITTIQQVENNPLKFSANVDEVLETMFLRRSRAYKRPVEAVQEGFDAISDHQLAMIAGIRSAFRSALGKFDPLVLEEEFKRNSKRRWFSRGGYWKAYREHYQSVLKDTERSYQELFGDEFVQAYEDQLRKLESARKKKL